ncbi:hypothetical protein Purlil1_6226 [Purpureocillium lilacinum]|uniref:C2H2-type zinc finger ascomycetes domain-containing protein n=1 Tax=Purpureocillium lilacinum TaxID=33203 RepID=A0ABR0BYS0_PURLI|nr:hypothetical protein Purlil1_6226 [Purpureocillium lilacinum]
MAFTLQRRERNTSFRHVTAHDAGHRETLADMLPRIVPVAEFRSYTPLVLPLPPLPQLDEDFVEVRREHNGSLDLASNDVGIGSSSDVERAVDMTVNRYGCSSSCNRAGRFCGTPPTPSALRSDRVYFRPPADIHADSLKMKLDRVCASKSAPRSRSNPFLDGLSQNLPDVHPPLSKYRPSHRSLYGLGSPYSINRSTTNLIASVGADWFHNAADERLNSSGTDVDGSNAPCTGQGCGTDPTPAQRSDSLAASRILKIHKAHLKSTRTVVGLKQGAQDSSRENLPGNASGQSDAVPLSAHGGTAPDHVSSDGVSGTSCDAPYAAAPTLSPKSNFSLSGEGSNCTKNSFSSSMKQPAMWNPDTSKLEGAFACECCPKKPKKFTTAEALR